MSFEHSDNSFLAQSADDSKEHFEAGRREAFSDIESDVQFDFARYGTNAINEFFGLRVEDDIRKDLMEFLILPYLTYFRSVYTSAARALQKGYSFSDLTGQEPPKSYRAVTGGDYNAGRISAVQDMEYVLLALDLDKVIDEFLETNDVTPALRKKINENTPDRKTRTEDDIREFVKNITNVQYDLRLSWLERHFIQKGPQPKIIGYEGEEPGHVRFALARGFYRRLSEPVSKMNNLKQRVPSSWPPLKVADAALKKEIEGEPRLTPDELKQKEEALSENKSEMFRAGFMDSLELFFFEAQKFHFSALNNATYGYTTLLGLSDAFNDVTRHVAEYAFADLRQDVSDRMEGAALGEGESYEDGQRAALAWLRDHVDVLALKGSLINDRAGQKTLEAFRDFWTRTAGEIIFPNESQEDDNAPEASSSQRVDLV